MQIHMRKRARRRKMKKREDKKSRNKKEKKSRKKSSKIRRLNKMSRQKIIMRSISKKEDMYHCNLIEIT